MVRAMFELDVRRGPEVHARVLAIRVWLAGQPSLAGTDAFVHRAA